MKTSMTLFVLLGLLTATLLVDSASANRSFNEDPLQFTMSSSTIPKSYTEKIRSVYLQIHKMLYPRLIVPGRLDVKILESYGNASYRFDVKKQEITVPYSFTVEGKTSVSGKEALPIFAHEFGHYLHYMNMMKRSTAIQQFVLKGTEEALALRAKSKELEDQLIAYKLQMYGLGLPANSPEFIKLKQKFEELKPRAEQASARANAVISELSNKQTLIAGFSEMTADLVAALVFNDPNIMTRICNPSSTRCQARSFVNSLDPESWSEAEEHISMGPSRAAIWHLLQRTGLASDKLVNLVIDVGISEIEKGLAAGRLNSPVKLNRDFIQRLEAMASRDL